MAVYTIFSPLPKTSSPSKTPTVITSCAPYRKPYKVPYKLETFPYILQYTFDKYDQYNTFSPVFMHFWPISPLFCFSSIQIMPVPHNFSTAISRLRIIRVFTFSHFPLDRTNPQASLLSQNRLDNRFS